MPALNTYQLTVSYNANGGSGAPSSQTKVGTSSTTPYTLSLTISTTKPTRSGYTFLGWSASSSASSASYSSGGSYSHTFDEISGSYSATLYAVWSVDKSTISLTDGTTAATIDDSTSISISRKSSSYTHTITYSFGSASGTIVTKTSSTTVSWSVPDTLASQIPNTTRGTCTLTCTTYNGNTSLGSTTLAISLYVKQSVKQKVGTVTTTEGASMPSGISVFVQNKSKIKFSIATVSTNAYGATVSSVSTTINGKTYNGTSFTTNVISASGSVSYTVTLTDSRGRTDTKTASISVYPYTSPTITARASRDSANNTHAIVSYTYSFASVNSQNTKQVRIQYKKTTDTTPTTATTITQSSTSGNGTYTITSTLDAAYPYNIIVEAIDKFTTVSYVLTLPSSGSRYIECDKSTGTVVFPLKTRHVGASTFDENTTLTKSNGYVRHLVQRTDTDVGVSVEVGTSGEAHGLYSYNGTGGNKWIIYQTRAGNTCLPNDLYLRGHGAAMGTIVNHEPSSSSIANNTWVTKITQTFSAGTFFISFGCLFGSNATGNRRVVLSSSQNSSSAYTRAAQDLRAAVNGVATQCSSVVCLEFTASTTLYLNCYQNSGSSISNNYPFMNIIRII